MLVMNLNRIFKARNVTQPYKFLVTGGFPSFTAHKYKTAKVEQIRVEHIERLCVLLNCTPNDLFEWFPDDLLENRDDHPLHVLRKREKKMELIKLLAKLPLQKLEAVERMLETV
jgi:DNA-binding Xre family transcriptional regulator